MAENARRFFDANILCLPAGYVAPDKALDIIHAFVTTAFDGGERYVRRIRHLANPNKYKLSAIGRFNADIHDTGDGVTLMDAQAMQYRLLGIE